MTVSRTLFWGATAALLSALALVWLGSSVHKDYGYEDVVQEHAWGSINARLLGNDRYTDGHNTVRGSPYNLIVSASFANALSERITQGCTVNFENIVLTGIGQTTSAFSDKHSIAVVRKDYEGIMYAVFGTGLIHLDYQDYKLRGKLSFTKECGEIPEQEINMSIAKKYTEELITLLDRLMGI